MVRVHEFLDVFPFDEPPRVLERDEDLLLSPPIERPGPRFPELPPLEVVHIGQEYTPLEFALPRTIYQGRQGKIEWQQMDFRQPMYHRNLDVDELSYQIRGDRTLMTEIGSVELTTGDLCRIPAAVCHDNWGRQESHLLFYIAAPCADVLPAVKHGEARIPPYEGWEPAIVNEVNTVHMADVTGGEPPAVAHQSDERLILGKAFEDSARLAVMRVDQAAAETTWVWKAAELWIGIVNQPPTEGLAYRRHRDCEEVQYQIVGRRTLVSQRGVVDIAPGDFVRIPTGTAFTSIADRSSRYLVVNSTAPFDEFQEPAKKARPADPAELRALRNRL
jgi:mannose-6-phosphate isomerase-like protein (cupin superfamily)